MKRAQDAQRRQLEERFEAERAVMRTQLSAVHQPQFWESAKPADIATLYGTARQWERFDEMARASREQIQDEVKTRYDLTPEEYLDAHEQSTSQESAGVDVEKSPEDRQANTERDAQRDHAEADRLSAVVAAGDLQNDLDTQNVAAAAEELWDSGDRRAKLADTLMERVGTTEIGRQGIDAVLGADLSNGTPPSSAVRGAKRAPSRGKAVTAQQSVSKDFGRE